MMHLGTCEEMRLKQGALDYESLRTLRDFNIQPKREKTTNIIREIVMCDGDVMAMDKLESINYELIYSDLERIVGPENVSELSADRSVYQTDIYYLSELYFYYGMKAPKADFIVLPENTQQIKRIMILANQYKIPVVPWSGGSGSMGGTVPLHGGLIIDLKRMNRILDLDEESLTFMAQAGLNSQDLEWQLNEAGYTYGHYPASMYSACLGGMLASRSAGVMSTKYGKIEDMVLGIEVVLPSGEVIKTPVAPKKTKSIGPDLVQLFVGSEGTLGIITEATLEMYPLPEERRFRAYIFRELHSGIEAVRKILRRGITPCVIRLYDEHEASKKTKERTLATKIDIAGSFLILAFDGFKEQVDLEEKVASDICEKEGGEDIGSEHGQYWWDHRFDYYYPPLAPAIPLIYGTVDISMTFDKMEKVYKAIKDAIEKFKGARFNGHFSHWSRTGGMFYPRFYVDPPEDPKEAVRLHNRIWNVAIKAALENGAVLNDHHGVGAKLSRFMYDQYGTGYDVLTRIKRTIDPNWIMNPGKLGF